MRTPKEFSENLKNRIITEEMLELVLYSLNKRAKNCRDKKRESYIKGKETGYDNYFKTVDRYKEQEEEYYRQKDFLLKKALDPNCIHEVIRQKEERTRYYDYDEKFEELGDKAIYRNGYFNREERLYVEFIDVLEISEEREYYFFYRLKNRTFHLPISTSQMDSAVKEVGIKVESIKMLETTGKEITDLVSTQFILKVLEVVINGEFCLLRDDDLQVA